MCRNWFDGNASESASPVANGRQPAVRRGRSGVTAGGWLEPGRIAGNALPRGIAATSGLGARCRRAGLAGAGQRAAAPARCQLGPGARGDREVSRRGRQLRPGRRRRAHLATGRRRGPRGALPARREAIARPRERRGAGAARAACRPRSDHRRAPCDASIGSSGAVASFEGEMATALAALRAGRDALAPYVARVRRPRVPSAPMLARGRRRRRCCGRARWTTAWSMPSADRCIFPLRPGGVHHHTAGREGGVRAASRRSPAGRPTTSRCAGC